MKLEMKVALIGAAAAIIAAFVPVIANLIDDQIDDSLKRLEVTLTATRDASPYHAFRLAEVPPSYTSHADGFSKLGFYLWPEADLTELLPVLALGTEMDPPVFITKADFLDNDDASSDPLRENHLKRLWRVIEQVGSVARNAAVDLPTDLVRRDGTPLFKASDSDADIGLAVLRAVYLGNKARSASADDPTVKRAMSFARIAFDGGSDGPKRPSNREFNAARFLATRQVFPILDLTATNPNSSPIVVTSVAINVRATAPAFSGIGSGPVPPIDEVTFELSPHGGRQAIQLSAPVKIAGQDTIAIKIKVTSDVLFGFLCDFELLSGSQVVGELRGVVVDIGFQPPRGSNAI